MPSTAPAVDGADLTFTCVDVVPWTGATVGWGGGGSGVSDGRGVRVGGRVGVMINGAPVAVLLPLTCTLQLLSSTVMKIRNDFMSFWGT